MRICARSPHAQVPDPTYFAHAKSNVCYIKKLCQIQPASAMATGIIGSVSMELEETFRMLMIELVRNLTIGECEQVAYIANVRTVLTASESVGNHDYRVNLLSTLESQARIGPLKLDFLERVFGILKRQDLLGIITEYKEKQCYKDAIKKRKKKKKKQDQGAAGRSASSLELSAESSSKMRHFQDSFRIFILQYSQIALSIRAALETRNLAKIEDTFQQLIESGDAVTRTLRMKLSAAGINRPSYSNSSGDSSGKLS